MKKLVLIITLSLVLFSCEKEKQLIVENTAISLISKVLVEGVSSYEYSYDEANLLSEEKSQFTFTKYSYNDKNLLTTSDFYVDPSIFSSSMPVTVRTEWVNPDNTAKSLTKSFEYDNNEKLLRVTYNRPSVSNSEYSEFTYENDRINRQTMYWQNELTNYIDFLYDEKGNLIKESKYHVLSPGSAELWTTTEYEFDNNQNPFQSFSRLMTPGKYTNHNNITKETYTIYFDVDQWTQKVQVINNSYEYNDRGYPVKVNGEAEYVYKY